MGGFPGKSGQGNDAGRHMSSARRHPIFEKAKPIIKEQDVMNMLRDVDEHIDNNIRELLLDALSGFFFFEKDDPNGLRMDLLLRSMIRETEVAGATIIAEGELGSKLYVVEDGTVEVTINGQVVREMGAGALIGELALLYDAPRSATVTCLTDCAFWVLSREKYKSIQALAASASMIQRSNWLLNCPELAELSSVDSSRLVGALNDKSFAVDENLFTINELTSRIILVEKGQAIVRIPPALEHMDHDELDAQLGIIRPPGVRRQSINSMSLEQIHKQLASFRGNSSSLSINRTGSPIPKSASTAGAPIVASPTLTNEYMVYEGCILGIGAIRAKAAKELKFGLWEWINGPTHDSSGGVCPVTITATEPVECSVFSIDIFERLFGPVTKSFASNRSQRNIDTRKNDDTFDYENEIKFEAAKFNHVCVVGTGSYGTVTLATYTINNTTVNYALKKLSKTMAVEQNHVKAIVDERNLLSQMTSPFILKLYGTCQTPGAVILVTEFLNNGDLWNLIYENSKFPKGLPAHLIQFYATTLVLALSHMHSKSVIYRDLKPENIMIDKMGYIRVIDFGFSKKLPYATIAANGDITMHMKSYTLCGTPEYIAPEFLFNTGVDHAADVWAFGVLLYEMYMGKTPFAPRKSDDMTQLFQNIASVKKHPVSLPAALDSKDGRSNVTRSLIGSLLKANPSDRLSVQEGSTECILDHKYFSNMDVSAIQAQKYVPDFIPPERDLSQCNKPQPVFKAFNDTDNLFSSF